MKFHCEVFHCRDREDGVGESSGASDGSFRVGVQLRRAVRLPSDGAHLRGPLPGGRLGLLRRVQSPRRTHAECSQPTNSVHSGGFARVHQLFARHPGFSPPPRSCPILSFPFLSPAYRIIPLFPSHTNPLLVCSPSFST